MFASLPSALARVKDELSATDWFLGWRTL